jgi:hypothetical protein
MKIKLHAFLNSAPDGGEWTAFGSCHFTSGGSAPSTHCVWGWVGPKLCIAATEKKKYFAHVGKKLLFLTSQHS